MAADLNRPQRRAERSTLAAPTPPSNSRHQSLTTPSPSIAPSLLRSPPLTPAAGGVRAIVSWLEGTRAPAPSPSPAPSSRSYRGARLPRPFHGAYAGEGAVTATAAAAEEYSLTLLKHKAYLNNRPLGRCLDGIADDERGPTVLKRNEESGPDDTRLFMPNFGTETGQKDDHGSDRPPLTHLRKTSTQRLDDLMIELSEFSQRALSISPRIDTHLETEELLLRPKREVDDFWTQVRVFLNPSNRSSLEPTDSASCTSRLPPSPSPEGENESHRIQGSPPQARSSLSEYHLPGSTVSLIACVDASLAALTSPTSPLQSVASPGVLSLAQPPPPSPPALPIEPLHLPRSRRTPSIDITSSQPPRRGRRAAHSAAASFARQHHRRGTGSRSNCDFAAAAAGDNIVKLPRDEAPRARRQRTAPAGAEFAGKMADIEAFLAEGSPPRKEDACVGTDGNASDVGGFASVRAQRRREDVMDREKSVREGKHGWV
jgi:hypothetical protein